MMHKTVCSKCKGEKKIFVQVLMGLPETEELVKCPKCNGKGRV